MQNMGIEVLFKGINSLRLWQGLWVTIRIALISMVFSIILGFLLGMVMNIPNKIIKFICRIYLEIVRIMPQLVLLFLVYFGAAKHLGMNLSGETAAVIVFTFWGTAEMGDLVRSALISIPKHQYDSGYGLGLNKWQVYLYIILPQTIRRLLPSAVPVCGYLKIILFALRSFTLQNLLQFSYSFKYFCCLFLVLYFFFFSKIRSLTFPFCIFAFSFLTFFIHDRISLKSLHID